MQREGDLMNDLEFPWWYTLVKWWLPLSLGFFSGAYIWLTLTGLIGVPTILWPLAWVPASFSQLDKIHALLVLGLSSSMVACTVTVFSSFLARGALLSIAESKAMEAKMVIHKMEDDKEHEGVELDKVVEHLQASIDDLSADYHTLLGGLSVTGAKEAAKKKDAANKSGKKEVEIHVGDEKSSKQPRRRAQQH